MSRRQLLAGGAALAVGLGRPGVPLAQGRGARPFVIAAGTAPLGTEGAAVPVWHVDGAVPAPTLTVRRGGEVWVRVENRLPVATGLHWRGVRLDHRMDGTPLAGPVIAPGGAFEYRFACPDAGTFLYHPFARDPAPLRRGLAGLLIVEEETPPEVDHDIALLFQAWQAEPGAPAALTINGQPSAEIALGRNARVRLRLANGTAERIITLAFEGLAATIIAVDGQPSEPFPLRRPQVTLAPGGRADLIADMTSDQVPLTVFGGVEAVPIGRLMAGAPARPAPRTAPIGWLPDNGLPKRIDLKGALRADIALGPAPSTPVRTGGRTAPQPLWAVEGSPADGLGGPALFQVKRGRTVVLAIANRTGVPHVLQLHGHAARLLDDLDDGWKPWWHDSVPVPQQRTTRLAFVADNPGRWPLLVRRLDATAAGAVTWFEVS